jgi:hypothetical protein
MRGVYYHYYYWDESFVRCEQAGTTHAVHASWLQFAHPRHGHVTVEAPSTGQGASWLGLPLGLRLFAPWVWFTQACLCLGFGLPRHVYALGLPTFKTRLQPVALQEWKPPLSTAIWWGVGKPHTLASYEAEASKYTRAVTRSSLATPPVRVVEANLWRARSEAGTSDRAALGRVRDGKGADGGGFTLLGLRLFTPWVYPGI